MTTEPRTPEEELEPAEVLNLYGLRRTADALIAKIKAEALRDAANELSRMNTRAGVADPTRDARRVRAMADQIEGAING